MINQQLIFKLMRLEQSGHIEMHSAPKVKDLKDAEMNLELIDPFKYPMISICLHIRQCANLILSVFDKKKKKTERQTRAELYVSRQKF